MSFKKWIWLIPENTWYKRYDWLIKHVPESSQKNSKQYQTKNLWGFLNQNCQNWMITHPHTINQKRKKKRKIGDAFEGRYVEYKDKKIDTGKKLSMKG